MRRLVLVLAVGGACALAYFWIESPLVVSGEPPADGFTRVKGVVHVHTIKSDGGGTPEQVVAAAKRAGLDFVAISDHNNLDARPIEGYHDGVLAIVGTEISTTAGHILGLGLARDPIYRFSGDAQDALDDIQELGGSAFATHPVSPRVDFRYNGWELPGPWGIELLNGDSQWREAGWGRLLGTASIYAVNPRAGLVRSLQPPVTGLAEWDKLLRLRNVGGIAGADAHNRVPISRRFAPRFPSYESIFGLIQNHVLLERRPSGNAAEDAQAIVRALSLGQSYVGVDGLAPASGFFFAAESDGRRYSMGATAPASATLRLRAGGAMPAGTRVRLLKDGAVVQEAAGALAAASSGAGVYRVEAYVPRSPVPWVITNPIYIFDDEEWKARSRRELLPEAPAAPRAAAAIDDFEGAATSFAPEFDSSSAMEKEVVLAGAGPDRSHAARLAFRLGEPGPGRPFTWCALVGRGKRDLGGRQGLVFSIKGDGIYRLWVQVRDANPASADEGEEWWFASVKTTTDWRRVAVPFARLRSLNKNSDGRLDLDKLRGIVFVLDQNAVKPGTKGEILIDDVGVY